MTNHDFIVSRTDLSKTRLDEAPALSPGTGEAVLDIERFALTANNITYGVAGDMIGYWQFFPAAEGEGRIPVWGIGKVSASNHPDVKVGDRYYGYYPMSNQLKVKPEKVNARGMIDASSHRAALPPVYNQYSLMNPGNGFDPAFDNHAMVYRPLFATAFILDDWLDDNDFFGGDCVILGSASSKTAFGLAFMLRKRTDRPRVIGLTSDQNVEFVKSLGLYDEVAAYPDVETLDAGKKAVYVDMSGNRRVLARVHHHFNDNLVNSCGVGATHWEARDGEEPGSLPGAKPTMFFAPTQMQKRNQDWGPELYAKKLSEATADFFTQVDQWVTIEEHPFSDIGSVYDLVLRGPSPDRGIVVVT